MSISSGTVNYPSDFDLNPLSGSSTLNYVIDQERNPITGIVSVSGTLIRGLQINTPYSIIQKIEETLGLNPQSTYNTVSERLDNITFSGSTGVYVSISGDTMVGTLYAPTISGTIISGGNYSIDGHMIPTVSGISDLGSVSNPFRTVYADDLVDTSGTSMFLKIDGSNSMTGTLNAPVISGTIISGDTAVISTITSISVFSDLISGTTISGLTATLPTINSTDITSTNIYSNLISGTNISGDSIYKNGTEIGDIYVDVTGDTITGTLNVDVLSGTTISGGSIYQNGSELSTLYVDITGDTMTGTLNAPVLSGTLISGDTITSIDLTSSNIYSNLISGTNISGDTIYENGDRIIVSGVNLGTATEVFSGKTVITQ